MTLDNHKRNICQRTIVIESLVLRSLPEILA